MSEQQLRLWSAELSEADLAVLRGIAEGKPIEAIAREHEVSERTIRRRTRSICDRLGVTTPIEAVVWAVRRELL